ncbi:MAG TPA: hypothetical protein VD968_17925 [Pyrinomonadaceae bacterium]|nr:hypothetical protein [Pyrinomonadaceae bacterium]
MRVISPTERNLLGLFELDDAGTVLYSRVEPAGKGGARRDLSGLNFYEEVAPFSNVEEFRRRVTLFARGGGPVNRFNFDCLYDTGSLHVKVLLARVSERADRDRTKSVIVHIRECSQPPTCES